jgi:hypothetical protein
MSGIQLAQIIGRTFSECPGIQAPEVVLGRELLQQLRQRRLHESSVTE